MAISQEKVCGWLVYYGSGEIGQYPHSVIELEVIPEVWEMYVLKHPAQFDTFDDSEYCGFFAWKRELSFDEKIKRDTGCSLKPIQDLLNKFLVFEVWCLKNWNDFCAEYQNLTPEQIQTAKKFCVLDSVTTPAAPADPVEYVLDITIWNRIGNVWSRVAFLGPLFSPAGFDDALSKNQILVDTIKRYVGKNASGGFTLKCLESKQYFSQYPERRFNTLVIPELADFVKAYNAGGSQAAPASGSFLVSPDPALMAPSDPAAAPEVIQETFAEIRAVRDSKRKTTLTVQEKTNTILEKHFEKQNELLERLIEVNEQAAQSNAETARNTGTIAENTSSGNAKPKTRLETLRDLYLTYYQTVKQNPARYLMREKHKCSYEEIWKIERWGENWDAVDPEIKKLEIANIRAGVSQARPKRS